MAKYKQQKADSQNRPFKKRESTLPKREEDKIKQLAVVQPTAPSQRVVPRVSHWGPPIPPPVTQQWGPYGVWVSYPPATPMHSQQSSTSQDRVITSRTLTPQESGKAPMQQVYVHKKVEIPIVPPPRARPQSVITIGSMEAPVTNHDEPIVIEEILASKQDEDPKDVFGIEEKKRVEGDSKYWQPIWSPHGLNKTQRCKLQRARHKQQKREKLAKMENEIINLVQMTPRQ
ncbi:unnamed protein product [Miscanthus lutarioriparius]|uniref:Uncharacterized protein n=1 Tax=Miscanthus lutarioriparius TaxID=422564 RepID=A0A811RBZ4_9POAL|nr:unnamed protein product [Miscanthus lutarioriparius]